MTKPPPEVPISVLVVDDEPTICRAMGLALTRAGYEVVLATSGEHAQSLLAARPFDCLITDLRMPDIRGDELFAFATARQPHLAKRTMFSTGDGSEDAEEMMAACNCPVLLKPFDIDVMLHMVAMLVRTEGSRFRTA